MERTTCFPILLLVCIFFSTAHSKLALTNIKCDSLDESQWLFNSCILKSVNRTYKYLTIHVNFPKAQPINNIKVNLAILRKENGYKPFLYNITVDACKYAKNRKSNKVIQFVHSLFEKYSTLNKTCPYGEHDELVEKLPVSYINNLITEVLPVPHGDYALLVTYFFYNKKVAKVTVFASLT